MTDERKFEYSFCVRSGLSLGRLWMGRGMIDSPWPSSVLIICALLFMHNRTKHHIIICIYIALRCLVCVSLSLSSICRWCSTRSGCVVDDGGGGIVSQRHCFMSCPLISGGIWEVKCLRNETASVHWWRSLDSALARLQLFALSVDQWKKIYFRYFQRYMLMLTGIDLPKVFGWQPKYLEGKGWQ